MLSTILTLNDSVKMPRLGFGLFKVSDQDAETMTLEAFKVGYRSIDSARIYQNETGLGRALAKTNLKRDELFITTKLWNEDQGYDKTLKAFDASMEKLGIEELDLYLIHWPSPKRNLYSESWKALVNLKEQGRVRSIGVSNFSQDNLKRVMDETGVVPSINQVELHPSFQQKELRAFHAKHGIATESWSPLGQGQALKDPAIAAIAKKHHKTPAQVILRWHLQSDLVVIPKSVTPSRIHENFQVFDFELDADDLKQIDKLDSSSGRIGPDPQTAAF